MHVSRDFRALVLVLQDMLDTIPLLQHRINTRLLEQWLVEHEMSGEVPRLGSYPLACARWASENWMAGDWLLNKLNQVEWCEAVFDRVAVHAAGRRSYFNPSLELFRWVYWCLFAFLARTLLLQRSSLALNWGTLLFKIILRAPSNREVAPRVRLLLPSICWAVDLACGVKMCGFHLTDGRRYCPRPVLASVGTCTVHQRSRANRGRVIAATFDRVGLRDVKAIVLEYV